MTAERPSRTTEQSSVFVENLSAPELFASEASSFSIDSGVVSITFASHRYDNSVTPAMLNKVVVGRVVLPPIAARNLAASLYDFLAKNGMDPIPRPKLATEIQ